MADPLELAYLAGVVDSDGYVTIQRSIKPQGIYHGAVVGIAGTRDAPHRLAAATFGGRVACYANRENRPQFQWKRYGRRAVLPITELLPFLRVKTEHARLALALQALVDTTERLVTLGERDDLWAALQDLNEWRRHKQTGGPHSGAPGPPDLEAAKRFPDEARR